MQTKEQKYMPPGVAEENTSRLWKFVYEATLIALLVITFVALMYIKSKTATEFNADPILFVYTVFVILFIISRLIASTFYNKTLTEVVRVGMKGRGDKKYEPMVSVVIPCKNEEADIADSVNYAFKARYPKDKIEVIVINDGSTDGTLSVLRKLQKKHPQLIVVDWKVNQGKRHGMAEGFRMAKGEIVVQLDSDSYIDPKTFPHIIKPFTNPEIGAVSAHADPTNADKNWITRSQAAYYFMSFRILKAAESSTATVFCCSGCSSAYRKDIVMPILDEWLTEMFLGKPVTWGDDRSLTSWVLKLGYRAIYTDKVQAYTIVPSTIKQFFTQQLRWKKSWIINGIFTMKFIIKKNPFVALTYFYPLMLISVLTPIMVFRAMIYSPIMHGTSPKFYLMGAFVITTIVVIFYRFYGPKNKFWKYFYIWALLNITILAYIIVYAAMRIQDRGWGTR